MYKQIMPSLILIQTQNPRGRVSFLPRMIRRMAFTFHF